MQPALLALPLLLAAPPGAAVAPAPTDRDDDELPPRIQPWLGDLDAARERSRERNAPMLILAILEGEMTSDRVRDEIYHGDEFLKASQGTVFVVVNDGTHETKTIEVETEDGETVERTVCAAYEVPSCADHKRSMDRVYQEYHEDGFFKMPHLIAVLPNGKVHARARDEIQIPQAVRIAEEVKAAAGPSLSDAEVDAVKGKLNALVGFQKAGLWPNAWRTAQEVLAITEAERYATPARAATERAVAGMRADLAAAVALLEEGEAVKGYARLLDLRDAHAGTPVEKETERRVRKTERDRRYRDAVEKVKHRREAEELWAELLEALAEDKERSVERLAEKLIERYGDTPAGKRAAKRFPELVPSDG